MVILFYGCTSSSNNWEKAHPDDERLPAEEEVDYKIDISTPNDAPLPGFFHPDSLQQVATIGRDTSFDEKYYHEKGSRKLDIDEDGNLYITQYHTNTIKVYDKNGQYLYTVGKAGRGPGEFLELLTFSFDDDYRTLYALDAFEIEVFKKQGNRFEYETTIDHGLLRPFDLCLLNDDLFISGYRIAEEDKNPDDRGGGHDLKATVTPPITRFDLEKSEADLSFGYEYRSFSGFGTYDGILSQMMLSCNEESETVVGYQKDFPYIFGYDIEGHQKWVSKTEGYRIPRHIESKKPDQGNPSLIQRVNKETYDHKTPVQKIYNDHYELLQLVNMPPQPAVRPSGYEEEKEHQFRSILVNTKTGEQQYSNAYDRLGVKKDSIVVTVDRNPETSQRKFHIYELE